MFACMCACVCVSGVRTYVRGPVSAGTSKDLL